jgi:hypothetical protein
MTATTETFTGPSVVMNSEPSVCSPTARSMARAVRRASGMATAYLWNPAMVRSRRVTAARAKALGFQVAGEGVGAADREQRQRAGSAPGGELPQVQRVCLAS